MECLCVSCNNSECCSSRCKFNCSLEGSECEEECVNQCSGYIKTVIREE